MTHETVQYAKTVTSNSTLKPLAWY